MKLLVLLSLTVTSAFQQPVNPRNQIISRDSVIKSTATSEVEKVDRSHLYVPSRRDSYYQGNVARYLLDLDEEGATFDFCGGETGTLLCAIDSPDGLIATVVSFLL